MIRLADARALAEWADVVVLGGPDDWGDRWVGGVLVVAGVRAVVPVTAEGLLLVVAGEVARDEWLLDVLLRRAASAGCAAVLIGGTEPLGRASGQVARRLATPVLGTVDPMGAAVAVRVHLALPELVAARWLTAVTAACASAGPGVDAVVDRATAALQRAVWLVDAVGHVVSGGPEAPDWAVDGGPDRAGVDRSRAPDGDLAVRVTRRLQEPVRPDASLVHLVVATDHPRGAYLVLRRDVTDPLDAVVAALRLLAEVLAGRLAVQRLAAERDARHRMSLLNELLQGGGALGPEGPRRMLDQGWRLDGHHLGIRVDVPSALDPVALRPEVLRAFTAAGVDAQVVEHGDGWAAWTTFPDAPDSRRLQAQAAAVRRVQWLLRSHLPTAMGVGSLQPGPEGLVRSLGEATDAARIARTRAAGGHLVQVDRLGLSQLLLAWTRTDTFSPAASSLLTPLAETPGLLETLAAYLDAESSIADTAAVLGVHRNTVTARIARAVDLLGVDLDDPDERLALQLACRSVLSRR